MAPRFAECAALLSRGTLASLSLSLHFISRAKRDHVHERLMVLPRCCLDCHVCCPRRMEGVCVCALLEWLPILHRRRRNGCLKTAPLLCTSYLTLSLSLTLAFCSFVPRRRSRCQESFCCCCPSHLPSVKHTHRYTYHLYLCPPLKSSQPAN